jgi:hypothetical protein
MNRSPHTQTVEISTGEFERFKHLPVRVNGESAGLGERDLTLTDTLNFGDLGSVPVAQLADRAVCYHRLTGLGRTPQVAALLFDCTGDPRFLDQYLPLALEPQGTSKAEFTAVARRIAAHPHLELRLTSEGGVDRTADLPNSARWIIAGYLLEALWERRDLLEHLLSAPREVRLYTSELAIEDSNGLPRGEYHHGRHSIELTLAQLYTGFHGEVPGVAPFLHALGHLLDDCDSRGRMGGANGVLLGMGRRDGALRSPQVFDLFRHGKRLEMHRYNRFRRGSARLGDPMPVGQPCLFGDDREFVAGYFELFFRAPRYFAAQNPVLYAAFALLLRRDPRRSSSRDCSLYVDQSRATYSAPLNLPPCGLRVAPRWWPF